MTTIIKAGTYTTDANLTQVVESTAGKALICTTTSVRRKKHLTCYTQTWVVKSAFGQQVFYDLTLAHAYYSRLPGPQVG
jgi:hypothetical protein